MIDVIAKRSCKMPDPAYEKRSGSGQHCIKRHDRSVQNCEKRGITLILSHVNQQPMKVMEKAGFAQKVGQENFCENIDRGRSNRLRSLCIKR